MLLTSKPTWVDIANLDVQRKLASVAEAMLLLTYWQIGLGIFGTIALILSLRETRRATSAALASTRAIIVIRSVKLLTNNRTELDEQDNSARKIYPRVQIVLKNVGSTFGIVIKYAAFVIVQTTQPTARKLFSELSEVEPIEPEGSRNFVAEESCALLPEEISQFNLGRLVIWIYGRFDYEDVYGILHNRPFIFKFHSNGRYEEVTG